jgi:hypothetical protein
MLQIIDVKPYSATTSIIIILPTYNYYYYYFTNFKTIILLEFYHLFRNFLHFLIVRNFVNSPIFKKVLLPRPK